MNNDKNFINIKITKEYINNLFNNNNIVTKKIIIENQEQIKNKLNLCDYLNNNTKRSIHGKKDFYHQNHYHTFLVINNLYLLKIF